jgi:hypothetical protein
VMEQEPMMEEPMEAGEGYDSSYDLETINY